MRNSDWNSHNPETCHHHRHNQTASLSPSSSGHAASLLPIRYQYGKSSWTYGLDPCGAECSRHNANAGSSLHTATETTTAALATCKVPINIRHNDLDYTTGSSSITSSTTVSGNLDRKLIAIPFITTTGDLTSDGSNTTDTKPSIDISVNTRYLCANETEKNFEDSMNSVRRTASFTFSPKGSLDRINQRLQVYDNVEPKRRFSRFAKTLDFIRNKIDSYSTSTLYPSKEEVMQWQESFERLLNHKYGCLLFRTFLKGEFSDENVDFWIECEEFRKMKEGKKSTIQKAHSIYTKYIAEQSPKEVNLDSDTRAATKAALENGAKPNMFSLAQTRIEQLMAKDSYRRFLKSKLFLDILSNGSTSTGLSTNKSQKENEHERQSRLAALETQKVADSTHSVSSPKNSGS
uniref:RGS domain-containing protein n=1 Tax=Setaria digitata TaxID=48799 RepID=A0A915PJR6_9BILA